MPSADKPAHKGWHSRGYLPHFDSPDTVQHVIFRTIDSLPVSVMFSLPEDLPLRRRIVDEALDKGLGVKSLLVAFNAEVVENAMLHFDGQRYHLLAWCIMPNHVHVVVTQMQGFKLSDVVGSWKGYSARQINLASGVQGAFWAPDYFDRFMRSEAQLNAAIDYVQHNPVKAGLVAQPEDWRFSSARRKLHPDWL